MSDKIRALANSMVSRKKSRGDPYILLLGAGASLSSKCSSMAAIVDDFLEGHERTKFNTWEKEIKEAKLKDPKYGELLKKEIDGEKYEVFLELWKKTDNDTKYSFLRKHLWDNKIPSKGYKDLEPIRKVVTCYNFYNTQYAKSERMPGYLDLL